MAKKETISRLGAKPAKPPAGLRENGVSDRARAFTQIATALVSFNSAERVAVLAAVAEFYGLTLVVEN